MSDMTNLTQAKDAVACLIETEERRRRGAAQPVKRQPVRQNCSWGTLSPHLLSPREEDAPGLQNRAPLGGSKKHA